MIILNIATRNEDAYYDMHSAWARAESVKNPGAHQIINEQN